MSMTRLEHLLTIAAEECTEIGQRVSKALRFTLGEVQPGQALTNAERIMYEFRDLQAVMEMLEDEGALPSIWIRDVAAIEAKKNKVEVFLAHSAEVGTLSATEPPAVTDALREMVALWERVHPGVPLGRPTVNAAEKALNVRLKTSLPEFSMREVPDSEYQEELLRDNPLLQELQFKEPDLPPPDWAGGFSIEPCESAPGGPVYISRPSFSPMGSTDG